MTTADPVVAIVGGGPAGLFAAETLATAGVRVAVYDRMPAVGRKFMLAGRGGLNLTHSEPFEALLARYGSDASWLESSLRAFPPEALRRWCEGLGEPTFVGSSGRVFPVSFRATPLLRSWLRRLNELPVSWHMRHTWDGWDADGNLRFLTPSGLVSVLAEATILALGGASWPRMGSTGAWVDLVRNQGIAVSPLMPANSGFVVDWSDHFRSRFAGIPVKNVTITCDGETVRGEAMITTLGIEGGVIYALGRTIRAALQRDGIAEIRLDLQPDRSLEAVAARLARRRPSDSLSTALKKVGLSAVAIGLVHEVGAAAVAAHLKSVPLELLAPTPIDRAISAAGGIASNEIDPSFGLRQRAGVFVAGEMLDWDAPTGGYLLQACFSTGRAAAQGVLASLGRIDVA